MSTYNQCDGQCDEGTCELCEEAQPIDNEAAAADSCEHEYKVHRILPTGEILQCDLCLTTKDYEVDP